MFRQHPSHLFYPWEMELQTTPINDETVETWTLSCKRTVGLFKVNLGLFSYIILTPVSLVCFEGQIPVGVFQSLPNTLWIHSGESRWRNATQKRWRFVKGHEKPRLMGVAIDIFHYGGIIPLCRVKKTSYPRIKPLIGAPCHSIYNDRLSAHLVGWFWRWWMVPATSLTPSNRVPSHLEDHPI